MKISVNDNQVEVDGATTVSALLTSLGYPERGIAVSVNYTVLPRSDWETKVSEFAQPVKLDVLAAVQGG